ncbi:MAG: carbohydrate kinase family protein [Gallicola sp.]|nr:carbohydrate kinase family protein [Gallicola sp.]
MKEITVIGAAIIDVLAGPADPDVFQTGSQPMETIKMSFGGDGLNESVVLKRLGKEVDLISKVGNDDAGARVLDYIQSQGLPLEKILVDESVETSINIVLIDEKGERHFLTNPKGSLRKLSEEDIMHFIDDTADIVSFASVFVSPLLDIPAMERIFKQIKLKPGRLLAADLTKAKNGEKLEDLKRVLPLIDYIFPNEEEISLLTGIKDRKTNADLLVEAGVSCAVIKLGKEGCLIRTKNKSIQIPAYPVEKVVDSTGAGDSFTAGFLWALSNGMPLKECGIFSNAAASCAVEVMGATNGIQSLEEPMKRFEYLKSQGESLK